MANQEEATASSSSCRNSRTYDVFLSFRGEDARNSFVSHLYEALDSRGIYTFKDDEKFKKGRPISELIQFIDKSRFSIVVLSANFANSVWCLDELVRILDRKDIEKAEVIPIFYNVDPSHVRNQEDIFGEGFAKLLIRKCTKKQRLELPVKNISEREQQWRRALEDVSKLSGYDTRGKNENMLIKEIAQYVFDKLHEEPSTSTQKLVGIDSQLKDLDSLLGIGSNYEEVRFVGIWGMGGIGKSTLARAAYNRCYNQFEGYCFLPDVKQSYRTNGPKPLQKELLCSVLKDRSPISCRPLRFPWAAEQFPISQSGRHHAGVTVLLLLISSSPTSSSLRAPVLSRCRCSIAFWDEGGLLSVLGSPATFAAVVSMAVGGSTSAGAPSRSIEEPISGSCLGDDAAPWLELLIRVPGTL